MQREFQIMKNTIMIGKYRDILEKRTKINVNDHSFNNDMKECLDSHKFSILGRIKQSKEGNN
jgi:predicted component of type VI protein secretion system